MKIELVKIDDLDLDPKNARKHDAKNLRAIADSLEQFGQRKPIVVWGRTVVAGNGTMAAARSLGWKEIQVARVPDDWNADQVKAYALADNRSAELAEWDDKVLASQLLELDEAGFDISTLGFELPVEDLLDVVEDELPEEVELKSKLGQVWKLGRHRVMCGDSTDVHSVKRLMNNDLANMVFTDPPYNTGMKAKTNDKDTWLGHMFDDDYSDAEWNVFLKGFTSVLPEVVAKDCALYISFAWKRNHELLPFLLKHFRLSNIIVWDKMVHGLGSDYKYVYEIINVLKAGEPKFNVDADNELPDVPIEYPETYELINVFKTGKPELNTFQGDDREYQDVWHIQRVMGKNDAHATAKPLELCGRAIRHASKKGEIVLDLFGGSGSTLVAAEQLGRVCYMMEFDPKYVDVIIARWEKLTGLTAELIEG
jgi:DNA modification methylase